MQQRDQQQEQGQQQQQNDGLGFERQQEQCDHSLVLRALHQEFIAYGLVPLSMTPTPKLPQHQQEAGSSTTEDLVSLVQSTTGAFLPLRYAYRHDANERVQRIIEIRALSMFDDLIVNATATTAELASAGNRQGFGSFSSPAQSSSSSGLQSRASNGHIEEEGGDVVVRRALTLDVGRWLEDDRLQEDDVKEAEEKSSKDDAQLPAAGTLTPTTITETAGSRCSIPRALRDDFRSAVRSGLLLHLCPPSGQFAALFGVEESLRRGILGMLGAKDLATFGLPLSAGLASSSTIASGSVGSASADRTPTAPCPEPQTSRAAAVSSASDSLWAPLIESEFSEREQHAVLFLSSSSAQSERQEDTPAHSNNPDNDDNGTNTDSTFSSGSIVVGKSDGSAAGDAESSAGATSRSVDNGEGDEADNSFVESGESDCGKNTTESSEGKGSTMSSRINNSGGGVRKEKQEGASRRLYAKLHTARVRRAAVAADQRRRMTILEMSALGRLGRTWGLYPWAPYLPRGPYHTPGPAFPEYNWGPGIGMNGTGGHPDGLDVGVGPHSTGARGWRRPGSWRSFGIGGVGGGGLFCGGGFGGGGAAGAGIGRGGGVGVPPPVYGSSQGAGRRGRSRLLGHIPGFE